MNGLESSRRVEAFSDGVFAIAITLLVLDLTVPPRDRTAPGHLAAALGHEWPAYFAYLVSFLIIGIIWVNHHTVFAKVKLVDRLVLFAKPGFAARGLGDPVPDPPPGGVPHHGQ
jgi:uncharacterized membrane protein